eukprot:GDKJ01057367.1.p1 GENE.GDKJ01057367.1~~GDKJ01057367.1.p1  ORF type:complete len:475 (+),score=100.77 GDKJ01057367.1:47-1471(+)
MLLVSRSSSSSPLPSTDSSPNPEFGKFRSEFSKEYSSIGEHSFRENVFLENISRLSDYTRDNAYFKIGINTFCDMTIKEYSDTFHNPFAIIETKMQTLDSKVHSPIYAKSLIHEANEEDVFIDWRLTRCFGVVKNQGNCKSCWAFTANALLELMTCVSRLYDDASVSNKSFRGRRESPFVSHEYRLSTLTEEQKKILKPKLINTIVPEDEIGVQYSSFSEQFLLDCNSSDMPENQRNYRCMGGFAANAIRFSVNEGGVFLNGSYPYTQIPSSCPAESKKNEFKKFENLTNNIDYNLLMNGSEIVAIEPTVKAVREALRYSPVGISICTSTPTFVHYVSGIMHDDGEACSQPNKGLHAVLIVGYGEEDVVLENGKAAWVPYFVIRNSHSHGWGEGGYGRIRAVDSQMSASRKKADVVTSVTSASPDVDLSDLGWRMRPFAWVKKPSPSSAFLEEERAAEFTQQQTNEAEESVLRF